MGRSGPAPTVDEREFVPSNLDEARHLYEALVEAGVPVSRARGVTAWVITLPESRKDDPATDTVRSRYRQCLGTLGRPPWDGTRAKGVYINRPHISHQPNRSPAADPGLTALAA